MRRMEWLMLLVGLLFLTGAGGDSLAQSYTYDRAGRLVTLTYDDSTQIAYTYDRNGNIVRIATGKNVGTDVPGPDGTGLPTEYALEQNYPNPFNPSTVIDYALPRVSYVSLRVFDILGRVVETLVADEQVAGWYSIRWDPGTAPSGIYFAQMRAGDYVSLKKMMLVK